MTIHIDQLNREVALKKTPVRIISLVPSITELLGFFNLKKEVVGITKFCEFPELWKKQKTIIGGTKIIRIRRSFFSLG